MKQVWQDKHGFTYPSELAAVAGELKWSRVRAIQELMDDGKRQDYRFIDAGACAIWMADNADEVV
jgi:hypothetical protein